MSRLNRHYRAALQPLLDRVLSLPAPGQRLWLDELRTDCPTVARDVEALLRDTPLASAPPRAQPTTDGARAS